MQKRIASRERVRARAQTRPSLFSGSPFLTDLYPALQTGQYISVHANIDRERKRKRTERGEERETHRSYRYIEREIGSAWPFHRPPPPLDTVKVINCILISVAKE